jgi:electron transport complex protein RnfC
VQYYRYAKTTIWQQERERKSSDISRERHEAHQQRLDKIKREREEKLRKKRELLKKKSDDAASNDAKSDGSSKQAVIAEAVARAQAKKVERLNDDNKGTD